jgi:hypothetical protein
MNIKKLISDKLKELKLFFEIIEDEEDSCTFRVDINSVYGFIFCENLIIDKDNSFTIQFYSRENTYSQDELYHSGGCFVKTDSELYEEIYELVDATKEKAKVFNSIKNKLRDIREIFEENGLEFQEYITINRKILL